MFHHTLSKDLQDRLSHFNQKALSKAEILLFAKAISDTLPLAPEDTENIPLFTLSHRYFIDECRFTLSYFCYVESESAQLLYNFVDQFTQLRYSNAYKPGRVFFQGETDTVIDDLSRIEKYINRADLCCLADIATKANWYINIFYDLVAEVKLLMPAKSN